MLRFLNLEKLVSHGVPRANQPVPVLYMLHMINLDHLSTITSHPRGAHHTFPTPSQPPPNPQPPLPSRTQRRRRPRRYIPKVLINRTHRRKPHAQEPRTDRTRRQRPPRYRLVLVGHERRSTPRHTATLTSPSCLVDETLIPLVAPIRRIAAISLIGPTPALILALPLPLPLTLPPPTLLTNALPHDPLNIATASTAPHPWLTLRRRFVR
jgi:hypothetical protein